MSRFERLSKRDIRISFGGNTFCILKQFYNLETGIEIIFIEIFNFCKLMKGVLNRQVNLALVTSIFIKALYLFDFLIRAQILKLF